VWAYTHPDHLLKFECPALGADVEDVAWDAESKRILAVGGGQTKAKVFSWDTGSNLAEVVPHNKKAITGDLRPTRPFRMVTGAEDFHLQFYSGPPFKYTCGIKEHSNFVNCVRYAPDGSRFVSVSSDKTGIVYDGETGAVVGKLDAAGMHAGSVFHCAWSPDSKSLATSGGDKTVRIWDMTTPAPYKCIAVATLGTKPEDMQQSVIWPSAGVIVSTSLDGTLNVFNAADIATGPVRRITGHQQPAVCMDVDASTGNIYTACMAGRTCVWRPLNDSRTMFEATVATGEVATKKAAAIAVAGGELAVAAWDDKLRIGDATTGVLKASVALGGQPKGLAVSSAAPDVRVVPTGSAVLVVKGAAIATTVAAAWGPTCVDISPDGTIVAVGGNDKKVHIFRLAGTSLTEEGETKEAGAAISCVAVAPDGKTVAAGDALREVRLYDTATRDALVSGRWMNHTTRVTGLKWSPSGKVLASVSTDRRLCIWDPKADSPKLSVDLANPHPFVSCSWASETDLWTLGSDGVAVIHKIVV
jgi:WD40 repeat protein